MNNDIVSKFKSIHGEKYDYRLVNYKNNYTKVEIICKEHGIFSQNPNKHLKGQGCSGCSRTKKLTNAEFILRSNNIHANKYDYSLVNYSSLREKVTIICKEHGNFYNHLTII